MKRHGKSILLPALFLTAGLFLSGCASGEEEIKLDPNFTPGAMDRLTRQERDTLIRAAQDFAVRSKSVRKRLTEQQCIFIRSTRPEVRERYQARKYGMLEMRWRISKTAELMVRSRGDLTKERQNWELEICDTRESTPVPDGFLSPELEKNLNLPPK